ncbi:VOC family protein [Mongoliibacter ruber]|uniref:Catechol 2,3-dioxygenase-like lactoylglutathione lyase family enzyme n=1 Tax=Mongoliibacter ruber TaxID=1750599 RepID=A0A2T0WCA2_9BACT|nr:catechol 2,3-dioxygenase-like lactoylglutathione lyase family enzyme [Mongoliibacter ruber]
MKKIQTLIAGILMSFSMGYYANSLLPIKQISSDIERIKIEKLRLGAFSLSLNVKDLETSREFYQKLGFEVFAGSMEQNYLIMKNENSLIGLFQGMFEGNILTFNPGWDENGNNLNDFDDIREIQRQLKQNGIALITEADETTSGPASVMITDPDGNVILLDQHR